MVIMTEPGFDPEDTKRCKKDPRAVSFVSETENGADEKKIAKSPYTALQVRLNDTELIENRRKLPLSRSKTYDSSLTLDMKNEMKLERKKSSSNQFSKTNAQYHKLFKEVAKEELLKESFTCALQKEILYQGKLYISENWICFHSKVFGKDTKLAIPVLAVTIIKKTKTALLVPNALVIATVTDRFIFVSLMSRDTTYKLLKSVCSHLDNVSIGNSPNPSSLEHSFRGDRTTILPLDIDFAELDGLVQHRRKVMEESSSTGSQTPESEHSQEFTAQEHDLLPKTPLNPIHSDIQIKQAHNLRNHMARHKNAIHQCFFHMDIQNLIPLNGLLLFYAIMVCLLIFSTFYMQSRIGYLEERLSSMGPFKESALNELTLEAGLGNWHINANSICDELTANLAKLDKIQRNLQRLLEDTN
ncbi:GRAM domain-containing protein 2B isoform 2-T2 [Discoglossus pictus]